MSVWDELQFFQKNEFDCKCGCGRNEMESDFLRKLDDLRMRLQFPLIVTSGYRCPDYNEQISSTGREGPHTTGHAVDFGISGERAHALTRQALLNGMTGVGLKQHGPHDKRFIHLDDLTRPPRPNVWTYGG